jgi:hypothetical protein
MAKNQKRTSTIAHRRTNRTQSKQELLVTARQPASAMPLKLPPLAWKLSPSGEWRYVKL